MSFKANAQSRPVRGRASFIGGLSPRRREQKFSVPVRAATRHGSIAMGEVDQLPAETHRQPVDLAISNQVCNDHVHIVQKVPNENILDKNDHLQGEKYSLCVDPVKVSDRGTVKPQKRQSRTVSESGKSYFVTQEKTTTLANQFLLPEVCKLRPKKARKGGVDHHSHAIQAARVDPAAPDLAQTILQLKAEYLKRISEVNQRVSSINRAKAMCRRWCDNDRVAGQKLYSTILSGGDVGSEQEVDVEFVLAFQVTARDYQKRIERRDKRIAAIAATLPGASFVLATKGVSLSQFGCLIGMARNLSDFPNPGKLWRWYGIGINPNGTRQRRVGGSLLSRGEVDENGKPKDPQKFDPVKRSFVWTIGDTLLRQNGDGAMKAVYDTRKPIEMEKCLAIRENPELAKRYAKIDPLTGKVMKYAAGKHAHNRAKRYMEKRFLKLLWIAWNTDLDASWPEKNPVPVYGIELAAE